MSDILDLVQFGGVGIAFFALYILYDLVKNKKNSKNGNGNNNSTYDFKLCFDMMASKLDDLRSSIDRLSDSVDSWGYKTEIAFERMKNSIAQNHEKTCELIEGVGAEVENVGTHKRR